MRMPGYSAERSLRHVSPTYAARGMPDHLSDGGRVTPQWTRDECLKDCASRWFWSPLFFGFCAIHCARTTA